MPDAAPIDGSPAPGPPRLWGRRALARLLDAVLALVLSCAIVWPFAWGAVTDALTVAGFGSLPGFVDAWDVGSTAQGAVAQVLDALEPVVLGTVLTQALVIWLYEVVATTLTTTTPGKAAARLRVAVSRDAHEVMGAQRPPWWDRPLRMLVRALVVVLPPALALGSLAAAALAVPGATELAEVTLALTIALALLALGGRGVHGLLTRTVVVPLDWRAELRSGVAGDRWAGAAREQGERRADELRHRAGQELRKRASGSNDDTRGRLREELRRRLPSALDDLSSRRPGRGPGSG